MSQAAHGEGGGIDRQREERKRGGGSRETVEQTGREKSENETVREVREKTERERERERERASHLSGRSIFAFLAIVARTIESVGSCSAFDTLISQYVADSSSGAVLALGHSCFWIVGTSRARDADVRRHRLIVVFPHPTVLAGIGILIHKLPPRTVRRGLRRGMVGDRGRVCG